MNKQALKDSWSQIKESLKQQYGKLKDEDLKYAEGKEEELYGKLGKKLDMTKEQVDKVLNDSYQSVKAKLEKAGAKH